ncbi:hypothetical protein [Falsibacillus albus]|uniref:DUF3953 domain-containing protein n=1 Tax=Falsibacillus albus TaxID=2478915 RepID=A0A3L7JVT5_9BACI|nr:hypothetical protein [Falsibacillus albus]RLQ94650.1 hypothetical protein D9X91_14045 [Falsibacillus albus]
MNKGILRWVWIILLAGLLIYLASIGETAYVWIILQIVIVISFFGRLLDAKKENRKVSLLLVIGTVCSVLLLGMRIFDL